jgi:hypothetical protein
MTTVPQTGAHPEQPDPAEAQRLAMFGEIAMLIAPSQGGLPVPVEITIYDAERMVALKLATTGAVEAWAERLGLPGPVWTRTGRAYSTTVQPDQPELVWARTGRTYSTTGRSDVSLLVWALYHHGPVDPAEPAQAALHRPYPASSRSKWFTPDAAPPPASRTVPELATATWEFGSWTVETVVSGMRDTISADRDDTIHVCTVLREELAGLGATVDRLSVGSGWVVAYGWPADPGTTATLPAVTP